MNQTAFVELLNLACGALLVTAVLILWRRQLASIIRWFTVQGLALTAIAALLAADGHDARLGAVTAGVFALRVIALPLLLRRALARAVADGGGRALRETSPVVNVAASLLAAAVLTLLAYAVSRPLVQLTPASPAAHAIPVGLAVALIGFFALVTRRRAMSQLASFLLMDNGITAVGLLTTAPTSLILELGISLDVLFAAAVLQVLTSRVRDTFGHADLDELRELRD
jgi:hydrogenase-4 component E